VLSRRACLHSERRRVDASDQWYVALRIRVRVCSHRAVRPAHRRIETSVHRVRSLLVRPVRAAASRSSATASSR